MKLTPKRMNEKQLMQLSVACGAVGLLAIGFFVYQGYDKYTATQDNTTVLKVQRDNLERMSREIPNLTEEIASLQDTVAKNVKTLPRERDVKVNEFLSFLDEAAEGTRYEDLGGIDLVKFAKVDATKKKRTSARGKAEPVKKEHFQKHAYQLLYKGSFYQFAKFANIIENDDRFMSIAAFKIEQPKKLEDPLKDMYLKIVTYTYKPNDASTGATP